MSYALAGILLDAARVPLNEPVTVHGQYNYTIGTNVVSCNDTHIYAISDLSNSFGKLVDDVETSKVRIACGDGSISVGDFGILFSCMVAMNAAYSEIGAGVPTEADQLEVAGMHAVWFGNNGVIYAVNGSVILPLKHMDIRSLLCWETVVVRNFVNEQKYNIKRESTSFVVANSNGVVLCRFDMPRQIKAAYPTYFDGDVSNDRFINLPETEWDDASELGAVLGESKGFADWSVTASKYRDRVDMKSVVVRDDLICKPSVRYTSPEEFLGSVCYSDMDTIDLAVNLRGNLYVYKPWFTDDTSVTSIQVREAPALDAFYNVTAECARIAMFAKTVTTQPVPIAQIDQVLLEKIKEQFSALKLSRVTLHGALGRNVIPESSLAVALSKNSSANLYCLCPVGAVGNRVIVKQSDGSVTSVKPSGWDINGAFYDITEVVEDAQV